MAQFDFQAEPGEWPHGWQYYASSSSEHTFWKNVVLDQSCAADQAHLRSHSGPGIERVPFEAGVPHRSRALQNLDSGEAQIAFAGD